MALPASAECHKYFPLFRNGFGLVARVKEAGEDGWTVKGREGEQDESMKIND